MNCRAARSWRKPAMFEHTAMFEHRSRLDGPLFEQAELFFSVQMLISKNSLLVYRRFIRTICSLCWQRNSAAVNGGFVVCDIDCRSRSSNKWPRINTQLACFCEAGYVLETLCGRLRSNCMWYC